MREHTDRDAVFLDNDDHVFLLVTGPRRYLFGRWSYAQQWGYPRAEMARRFHARAALYRSAPLDSLTLDELAGVGAPLFVVVRAEYRNTGATVTTHPDLFHSVYDDGEMALYRVDEDACRQAMKTAAPAPDDAAIVRESGL